MNDQERKETRQNGLSSPLFRTKVAADIGAQIHELRTAAGMTPQDIEQATGYKATKIMAHERGDYPPKTVTELAAIAEAIGCTIRLVKN